MENWTHGESKCTQPVGGEPGFHSGQVALEPQGEEWERNKRRHANTDNDASKQKAVCLLRHIPFSGHELPWMKGGGGPRWLSPCLGSPLPGRGVCPASAGVRECVLGGCWGGRCWRWDMSLRLTLRRFWSLSARRGVVWLPGLGIVVLSAVKPTWINLASVSCFPSGLCQMLFWA